MSRKRSFEKHSKKYPADGGTGMDRTPGQEGVERLMRVPVGPIALEGNLDVPHGARGVVLFA